ncbi:hypothetical protein BSKO_00703 [Bryopsis sp. KO-2023]|nr:hypothetical protein BSKO_00703 [Bryopsis sp. KO-2023]
MASFSCMRGLSTGQGLRREAVHRFTEFRSLSGASRRTPIVAPCRCATSGKEVQSKQKSFENGNGAGAECKPVGDYPFEADSDKGGFFPTRDPGDFPSVDVIKEEPDAEVDEYDPLRDGPLRYLGYANELGEAFAAWLPVGGVPLSYAVAIGYVLVDTGDKGFKAYDKASTELKEMSDPSSGTDNGKLAAILAGERALDTVVWQLLASVAIPGATIHAVVAAVHYLLVSGLSLDAPENMAPAVAAAFASAASTFNTDPETVTSLVEKSVPTFSGLTAIPFIVHPIDNAVHAILNVSMRPFLRRVVCENGQGRLAGLAICDETCIINDFPVLRDDKTIVDAFRQSLDEGELEKE